jgi:hypothetical protein
VSADYRIGGAMKLPAIRATAALALALPVRRGAARRGV